MKREVRHGAPSGKRKRWGPRKLSLQEAYKRNERKESEKKGLE